MTIKFNRRVRVNNQEFETDQEATLEPSQEKTLVDGGYAELVEGGSGSVEMVERQQRGKKNANVLPTTERATDGNTDS